jgi:hypothetical protein
MTGILNVVLAIFGPLIMRYVPPASLLVPIGAIGFSFLGINEVIGSFGQPIIGFLPLLFLFIGWFANVKLGGFIPPAFTVIAIGTILAWIDPVTRYVSHLDFLIGFLMRPTDMRAMCSLYCFQKLSHACLPVGRAALG